jgi:hypothetical protein
MDNNALQIHTVRNSALRDKLSERALALLESPVYLSAASAATRGWVVAPVESGLHFSESDADDIERALRDARCETLFAIGTEDVNDHEAYYELPATKDALLAFNKRCCHFNYLITPIDEAFAILCTVDDYYLIAGSQRFVSHAVGGPVEGAWEAFNEFARTMGWSEHANSPLQAIRDRYFMLSGKGWRE